MCRVDFAAPKIAHHVQISEEFTGTAIHDRQIHRMEPGTGASKAGRSHMVRQHPTSTRGAIPDVRLEALMWLGHAVFRRRVPVRGLDLGIEVGRIGPMVMAVIAPVNRIDKSVPRGINLAIRPFGRVLIMDPARTRVIWYRRRISTWH